MEVLVTINPRKCNAMQVCSRLMPDAFELGTAGYSKTKRSDFTSADLDRLRQVALSCPTQAIIVEASDNEEGHADTLDQTERPVLGK
jgi:ferredoxin